MSDACQIYDRRERALVGGGRPVAARGRGRGRAAVPRRRHRRAAADPAAAPRAHRRSADGARRRSPTCARWRRTPRSIWSSAAGTPMLARRSRRRPRRDARRRLARARRRRARACRRCSRGARSWRARHYDLAINFEPDIRSNLLLAASGAAWTAGFASGGGGPLLDVALDYDPRAHTTDNARALVAAVLRRRPRAGAPATAISGVPPRRTRAPRRLLAPQRGPLVGVHVSGGRAIKQWDPERFARGRAHGSSPRRGATIVLTGSAGGSRRSSIRSRGAAAGRGHRRSRATLDLLDARRAPRAARPARHRRHRPDAPGRRGRHAGRRGVRPVAIRRATRRAVRTIGWCASIFPCSPCNRIRLPPARCVGHTPDCLACIDADSVFDAAMSALDRVGSRCAAPGQARMTDAWPASLDERTGRRGESDLGDYLDAAARGARAVEAHTPGSRACGTRASTACRFRRRFTLRGDSLWWFAELYLHKQQVDPRRSSGRSAALDALVARERPLRVRRRARRPAAARLIAPQVAVARSIRYRGPPAPRSPVAAAGRHGCARRRADAGGARVAAARRAARRRDARPRRSPRSSIAPSGEPRTPATAAPSPYIGPVLAALEGTPRPGGVRYVGVGPATNFRARRWWHPLSRATPPGSASRRSKRSRPLAALAASRGVWRERHALRRALWSSDDLRARRDHPRLRLLADRPRGARRHRAAAVALVGARDGRSGRGARRARSRRRRSPTPRPAAGDARSCSSAAGAASARSACSTASSTATG